jgi:transcriptional regulator with XRE-family HTH domain
VNFGEKIRELRQHQRYSQREVAARIGITAVHLGRIESGRFFPSVEVVKRLAEIYGVTPNYLVNDEPGPNGAPSVANQALAQRLELIDHLDEADQQALIHIIDCMLTKRKMRQLLDNPTDMGVPAVAK